MSRRRHPARRSGRTRRSERGAVLVELALVTPVLLLLSLATFDLGMAWRADIAVSNAGRSAARVASSLGVADQADYAALVALGTALGTQLTAEVERVVVFKAASLAGTVPAGCLTGTALSNGGSSTDVCTVYTGTELGYALDHPSSPPTGFSGVCGSGRRDRFWCPSTRSNTQLVGGTGLDYVGVHVVLQHATSTKVFLPSFRLADTAVMAIEPSAGES